MNEYLICDDCGNPVATYDNIEDARDALEPRCSLYACEYTFIEEYCSNDFDDFDDFDQRDFYPSEPRRPCDLI